MTLLKWTFIFLAISVVAGIFSFTDISAASAVIAQVLFFIFLIVSIVMLILASTIFKT